jgi:hypothetical protein
MEQLTAYLLEQFVQVAVDLNNEGWNENIPTEAGWYYIETDTPVAVFERLEAPLEYYQNNEGQDVRCRNYNLSAKATASAQDVNLIISEPEMRAVYSGYAQGLRARAKEHTFGHQGTAGLALANYPELRRYSWYFYYKSITELPFRYSNRDLVLKFGEQIWRANYGWPLLCSA